MTDEETKCPVPGCPYTDSIDSVAAHIRRTEDREHSWEGLGYSGAKHYKRDFRAGSVTTIGWLTDSHIGKSTGGYGNREWDISPAGDLNNVAKLLSAVDLDIAIHTGDLFHEDRTGVKDRWVESVEAIFRSCLGDALPIKYIKGNHAREQSKDIWSYFEEEGIAEPLTTHPYEIGNVAVYGVDHKDDGGWLSEASQLRSTAAEYKILCLHQSVEDVEEGLGSLSREELPDLVLVGHPHKTVNKKVTVDGKNVRILCYGATTRVGSTEDAFPPRAGVVMSGEMFSDIGYISAGTP
jgi:predicted phosphodiesterase